MEPFDSTGSARQRQEHKIDAVRQQNDALRQELEELRTQAQTREQHLEALMQELEDMRTQAQTRERHLERELLQSRLALRAAHGETERLRMEISEGQTCSLALSVNVGCSSACGALRYRLDELERERAALVAELEAQKFCSQDSLGEQVADLQDENERLRHRQREMTEYVTALKMKFRRYVKQLPQQESLLQPQVEPPRVEKEQCELPCHKPGAPARRRPATRACQLISQACAAYEKQVSSPEEASG
jgi:uncharacterized coiled-coil DUF342 family protein